MLGTLAQGSALPIGEAKGVSGGSEELPQCESENIHIRVLSRNFERSAENVKK